MGSGSSRPHCLQSLCLSPSGSPLQFYVDAINSRHVSAYGPGLSHGMVNKPATFTIVTKDAGEGEGSCRQRAGRPGAGLRAGPLISAPIPLQGVCPWPWRAHPRPRSPARITRMAPALCPTCPRRPETTASSCALMTSTSRGAPSQPRSQVGGHPSLQYKPQHKHVRVTRGIRVGAPLGERGHLWTYTSNTPFPRAGEGAPATPMFQTYHLMQSLQ